MTQVETISPVPEVELADQTAVNEVLQQEQDAVSREAQRMMALNLREKPAVLSVIQTVRQTPELWEEVSPVVKRSEDFRESSDEGHSLRTFTGLFAGVAMSERAWALMDVAIDREIKHDSQKIKEALRAGEVYVHTLVMGSGPQAAIYNSTKWAHDPEHPPLTLDASERMGGQFAQPKDAVWELNTRTRPSRESELNLPGRRGSINHLPYGVLQQADITSDVYGTQESLAKAIKVNHLLTSHIATGTKLSKINIIENPTNERPGLYEVELEDTETGEVYKVRTDRVILAAGLGKERTGLENADETTQTILAEEKAKLERGEDAQVLTYGQWAEQVGDVSNPFPLRGHKRVAVVSPMDSGRVAAKYMLGHGGHRRKSSAELDQVEQLVWIGQSNSSREEYMGDMAIRTVYKSLGLEMPLASDPEYNHRIKPVTGRAHRLERHGDAIRVFVKNKETGEESHYDVDQLVLATGFIDTTDELLPEGHTDSEFVFDENGQEIARRIVGTEIYKVGPSAKLPISDMQKAMSPAAKAKGLDTTVAVWATSRHTSELARMHAEQDRNAQIRTDLAATYWREIPLEVGTFKAADGSELTVQVKESELQKGLNPVVSNEDLVKLAVGDLWHNFRFSPELSGVNLRITREADGISEGVVLRVGSDTVSMEDSNFQAMAEELFKDPVFAAAATRLTDRAANSNQSTEITIPIVDRRVDVGGITANILRKRNRPTSVSQPVSWY